MSGSTVNQKIGARIQKLRREKGYTQQAFSEMIGVSNNYLSDIERGVSFPKTDKLVAICDILDCSADDLFCDVIRRGAPARAERLNAMLDGLSAEERERAFSILEAFIGDKN